MKAHLTPATQATFVGQTYVSPLTKPVNIAGWIEANAICQA